MQGRIIKGIAGFYYVHVETNIVYECKAKGSFRNKRMKPLVGDYVELEILDEEKKKGNIINILPRKNELIRPAFANVDQAIIIFAVKNPEPNFNLLDKFLMMMDYQNVPTIICFNKADLIDSKEQHILSEIYEKSGCSVLFTSFIQEEKIEQVRVLLSHKTTILAGPSGVGKSTLTNTILAESKMETGDISKIGRGRHTTRHSEIFHVSEDTYICDTPGFTSLNIPQMEKEDVRLYFPELAAFEGKCRFNGCVHINEPDCKVKEALARGEISQRRYESYQEIFQECKEQKKY